MADNRCSAHSFYVPLGDKSLNDFVEAQSNLSMSMRLLIKGFMLNYGDRYPDIAHMDLKSLIAATSASPETLAGLAAQAPAKERERPAEGIIAEAAAQETEPDAEEEPEAEAEPEVEIEPEAEAETPGGDEIITINDDEEQKPEEQALEEELEEEPEQEPEEQVLEEEPEEQKPGEKPAEQEPEAQAIETGPEEQAIEIAPVRQEPDEGPETQAAPTEAPKPAAKPKPASARASYNSSQDASEEASPDDLMSFMGGF